jgi:hypothetical protein
MTQMTAVPGQGFNPMETSAEFTIPTPAAKSADPEIVDTMMLCLDLRRRWEEISELLAPRQPDLSRLLGCLLSLRELAANGGPAMCRLHSIDGLATGARSYAAMKIVARTGWQQVEELSAQTHHCISKDTTEFSGILLSIRSFAIEATDRILRSPLMSETIAHLNALYNPHR